MNICISLMDKFIIRSASAKEKAVDVDVDADADGVGGKKLT